MTTLGEAFISVRADLAPFRKELEPQVKKAADDMEAKLSKAVEAGIKDTAEKAAKDAGGKAGDHLSEGIRRKTGDKDKPPWLTLAGALGGALDDGISALPTELKAAIVLGIIATVPIISAALAGAISAGVALGVVGLGVGLATQFQSVQDRWASFISSTRRTLISSAASFEGFTLQALDHIENRIENWAPLLESIFDQGAAFAPQILEGALNALQFILESIDRGLGDSDVFVRELAVGFEVLGSAIGDALEILVSTGEDGAKGLRDLIFLLASAIVATAQIIAVFTKLYGIVRQLGQDAPVWLKVLVPPIALLGAFVDAADASAAADVDLTDANFNLANSFSGVVAITKEEEKQLKALNDSIEANRKATFDAVDAAIAWERSIDELEEGFKKNGNTIAIQSEEGRRNLENLGKAIRAAQKDSEDRVKRGEIDAVTARKQYDAEIERIYKVAEAHGISRDAVNQYYGAAIAALNIPPPNTEAYQALATLTAAIAGNLEQINRKQWGLTRPGGNQAFADGGIVYGPTNALIGEAGAEAVIPLTRPARAAQLLQQSGLDKMLFGGGDISVQVFVGNEELDARTVKIVQASNKRQSQQLGFGAR